MRRVSCINYIALAIDPVLPFFTIALQALEKLDVCNRVWVGVQDEKSAATLNGFAFRVYLLFSEIGTHMTYYCKYILFTCGFVTNTCFVQKACCLPKNKRLRQACSAVNGAWGYRTM